MLRRWGSREKRPSGPTRLQQVCGCATEFLALLDWGFHSVAVLRPVSGAKVR